MKILNRRKVIKILKNYIHLNIIEKQKYILTILEKLQV